MKNMFGKKITKIIIIVLAVLLALGAVALGIYENMCGVDDIERHISAMAELMTPSQQDIQYVEENYAKLNSFEKKLVSNYGTYEYMQDVYTDELIDGFITGEGYTELYELVMSKLGKHLNVPHIEVDKENRSVNLTLVAGLETEENLMNNPEQAHEYLQTVMDDMVYVTSVGCEITSMYGMNMKAKVTTQEENGIEVMSIENGVVLSYILEAK